MKKNILETGKNFTSEFLFTLMHLKPMKVLVNFWKIVVNTFSCRVKKGKLETIKGK